MKLKKINLTKRKLTENYDYWLSLWKDRVEPEKLISELFKHQLLTTHTFSFEKNLGAIDIIPYKTIFSDNQENGILSNGYRKVLKINPDDDLSSRNIPEGLENYVFAYLGIHQPYYSRKQDDKVGINTKPFGVFVKSPQDDELIEGFDDCHASRRDIGTGNEEVDQLNKELEFLLAENARKLMSYQICNDSLHTCYATTQLECFWHYYGNPDLWRNSDYASNSWKKKAEFRYFEKIRTSNIKAVLWPIWVEGVVEGVPIFSKTYEDLKDISKRFMDIQFITYNLDLRKPEICFIEASYLSIKHYLTNGKFPESIRA